VVRRRLLRPALWVGPSGDRVNAPVTNTIDLGMDMIAEHGMPLRNTLLLLYSPECVEGRCSPKSASSIMYKLPVARRGSDCSTVRVSGAIATTDGTA
jgi:hypothetical protein